MPAAIAPVSLRMLKAPPTMKMSPMIAPIRRKPRIGASRIAATCGLLGSTWNVPGTTTSRTEPPTVSFWRVYEPPGSTQVAIAASRISVNAITKTSGLFLAMGGLPVGGILYLIQSAATQALRGFLPRFRGRRCEGFGTA